ncbi:MAG: hypothetical protein HZA52_21515 [Planctomycetes bacterium]|nr:hypothetical protein [Planctomycetota bacterium]
MKKSPSRLLGLRRSVVEVGASCSAAMQVARAGFSNSSTRRRALGLAMVRFSTGR